MKGLRDLLADHGYVVNGGVVVPTEFRDQGFYADTYSPINGAMIACNGYFHFEDLVRNNVPVFSDSEIAHLPADSQLSLLLKERTIQEIRSHICEMELPENLGAYP